MNLSRRSLAALAPLMCLAWAVAGCTTSPPPSGTPSGTGGAPATSPGGSRGGGGGPGGGGSGGTAGTGGTGGAVAGSGGAGASGGGSMMTDARTGVPDAGGGGSADATATPPDGGSAPDTDSPVNTGDWPPTPMGSEGGGMQPSYMGEIPIHYGPPVPPIVQMNCPEDPTQGWTEYRDSFHLERPYNVPINTRFSIINGIYKHWVFPNDRPHSTQAMGRNPRTEATYGGTFDKANVRPGTGVTNNIGFFTSGQRLYSADMLIEPNAVGSAFMQIHTTSAGGGPIGIRMQGNGDIVNNGSRTVVQGSSVPGGLVGKWFNFKASLNADTLEVKIYVNNCLKSTYKGDRGDGNFYFKNGVYFCKNSPNGCFSHYKNIHLYKK